MMKTLIISLLIVCVSVCDAQTIITFAGNGTDVHTGDGASATAAGIEYPYGCAFDSHNNFYFTEDRSAYPTWIRKVTPCGVISTVAGTGVAGYNGDSILAIDAKLNGATGLAFDSHDNLYICDFLNNRIRRVDAVTGIITTIAGTGTAGFSGDGGSAVGAMLYQPDNLCFDRFGNLFILDAANERIRKINTYGIISTVAGNGTGGYTGDGGLAIDAEVENMYGICSDTSGNIYFEQQIDDRVRKIDTAGIISTIIGDGSYTASGDGGPAIDAGLNLYGLAADKMGNIYIAGYLDNDVRKVDAAGIISTVAGNGTTGFSGDGGNADSAELYGPYGIAVDTLGNLYIADDGNKRIREVIFHSIDTPSISITASTPDTICPGMPVTFMAVASGIIAPTYQWLVNGVPVSTDSIYTYSPANHDSIRCVLSGTSLCITPSSNTIHFTVIGDTPAVHITVSPGDTECKGTIVTFTATPTNGGSAPVYSWLRNGIEAGPAGTFYNYTLTGDDSVQCLLYSSASCLTSSVVGSNVIHLAAITPAMPVITLSGPAVAPIGGTLTVTASVTGAGTGYSIRWLRNGVPFDTTTTLSVTYVKGPGTDTITAVVIPLATCTDSAVSPRHVILGSTVGTTVVANADIQVYPNPTDNTLYVNGEGLSFYRIFDAVGVAVSSGVLQNTNSISMLMPAGIYVLEVTLENGVKAKFKIVKE